MKATIKQINFMEKGRTIGRTPLTILEISKMDCATVMGFGSQVWAGEIHMKVNIQTTRNAEVEDILGKTEWYIPETSKTT